MFAGRQSRAAPGIHEPWKPKGTLRGRWTVATGAASKLVASTMITSLVFAGICRRDEHWFTRGASNADVVALSAAGHEVVLAQTAMAGP